MKKITIIVAILLATTSAFAQNETDFEINGSGTITKYNGSVRDVVIPAQIGGRAVTAIGAEAFVGNNLSSVSIGPNVTLERNAFGNEFSGISSDQNLRQTYYFENGFIATVTSDNEAIINGYYGTEKEISIPSQIRNLPVVMIYAGTFAFKGLTGVTIPNGIRFIGEGAFRQNQLTSVTIPNSVTLILKDAFMDNRLTTINLPNNLLSIGHRAFYNNRITSITIPNGVVEIATLAFVGNAITRITIGRNVNLENAQLEMLHLAPFDLGFSSFYNTNSRRAGTYSYSNGNWRAN
jgi:hypothetical protein